MSYRIHLNTPKLGITKQQIIDTVLEDGKNICDDKKVYSLLQDSFEIWNLSLSLFYPKNIINSNDEYPIMFINKLDLLELIKGYRNELAKGDVWYKSDIESVSGLEGFNYLFFKKGISSFFKKLRKKDILLESPDYFPMQYFYLIILYEKMGEDDFYVLTHG